MLIMKIKKLSLCISAISLLISITAFCGAWVYKGMVIENISLILGFIGVLATFVVISNYAQTKHIEDRTAAMIRATDEELKSQKKEMYELRIEIARLRGRLFSIASSGKSPLNKSYRDKANSDKSEEPKDYYFFCSTGEHGSYFF
jgi:hypothetical protein